jgi:pyridoxal phosphate enzyme (YggS family)
MKPLPSVSPARIAQNVATIRQRVAAAAARSGRPANAVTLVAVTKYVGPEEIRAVVAAGCRDLAESRPQQLWDRAAALADSTLRWHMVGHLQRNKVRRTLPLVHLVHSVDSLDLLEAVDRIAGELSIRTSVLVEVKISGEESKTGLEPEAVEPLLEQAARYPHVAVRGLMGMAALEGGPDVARRNFAALRELRDRLRSRVPEQICLDELSMGMSGDYEEAILEGATLVRVGSALFAEDGP